MQIKHGIIKEVLGKIKTERRNLPRRIVIGEKEIFDEKTIEKQFNDYFVNIGPNFVSNVKSSKSISYKKN